MRLHETFIIIRNLFDNWKFNYVNVRKESFIIKA